MTDRELLEAAAKAAGIIGEYEAWDGSGFTDGIRRFLSGVRCSRLWNPLTDDGDALRLAIKLKLNTFFEEWDGVEYVSSVQRTSFQGREEVIDDDDGAATRRAIVRAAAAMSASPKTGSKKS
jgi:hypothetical protein